MKRATKKPAKPQPAPSLIAAMCARIVEIGERADILDGYQSAMERGAPPWGQACASHFDWWRRAHWDEHEQIENAILAAEPHSVADALAMLVLASSILDAMDLEMPITSDTRERHILCERAIQSALGVLVRRHRKEVYPAFIDAMGGTAIGYFRHGPDPSTMPPLEWLRRMAEEARAAEAVKAATNGKTA